MLNKISLFMVFLAIPVLSGCATPPHSLTATENSISYEYNRNFTSSSSVAQQASTHCGDYGKKAELKSRTISPSGNHYTDIFDCK
jgi:uncharacterized lipoprotein YajG